MPVPGLTVSGTADSLLIAAPAGRVRLVRPRSDRSLIARAIDGSEADLELLFRRHWPRAYRAALLIVHDHAAAEDVAQEAMVAAIRRLDRFDRRRPFGPWLGAIVTNRAIDCLRAKGSRREIAGAEVERHASAPQPLGRYSDDLMTALGELSAEHRTVVVMRYVLDYTPGEIARALDLPRGTVNSRLRRALDMLEAELSEVTTT
jgi:RNA polymerase sigma-70 factor (ECF subfamily)